MKFNGRVCLPGAHTDWIATFAGYFHTVSSCQSTSNNFQIMPDLSQSASTFNGESGVEPIFSEYLWNINATTELHYWDSSKKICRCPAANKLAQHIVGIYWKWIVL